ncbi:hypothetical protein BDZ94DRAFT_1314665 [Collybia nuda]|uniref:HAT C-terminal dimerisation domain-containing protein n=1 Tax=Collybia nuda TaxID=64659 RepID=A0A9P5XSI3_9AGAR|nr:hypothetical protein BDZ94DRAFT_1314665 [Collybia nuda]
MKVQWGLSYVMLNHAESLCPYVDMFVYVLGAKAETPDKHRKIDALSLSANEWGRVGMFYSLLSHADKAQQAFSSACVPTLFNAIPSIKSLHTAWNSCSNKLKYIAFHPALNAACEKLNDYYKKTSDSDAHVFAMLLHPTKKMNYFKKHWDDNLQDEVLIFAKIIFKERYELLNEECADTDSDKSDDEDTSADPSWPWLAKFQWYLNTSDILPEDMSVVEWWGVRRTLFVTAIGSYPLDQDLINRFNETVDDKSDVYRLPDIKDKSVFWI